MVCKQEIKGKLDVTKHFDQEYTTRFPGFCTRHTKKIFSEISLIDLIDDVLFCIFDCFSTRELLKIQPVCKKLNVILKNYLDRFRTDFLVDFLKLWGIHVFNPKLNYHQLVRLSLDNNMICVISEGWQKKFIIERRFINFDQMAKEMRPCNFGPPETFREFPYSDDSFPGYDSDLEDFQNPDYKFPDSDDDDPEYKNDLAWESDSNEESDDDDFFSEISDNELDDLIKDRKNFYDRNIVIESKNDWYLQLKNDILFAPEDIDKLIKFNRSGGESFPGIILDCRVIY